MVLLISGLFSQAQQIKVACVGGSTTYGTGINKREVNNWPAQLQRLLGEAYLVKNFGSEGASAIRSEDNSYDKTEIFQQSIDFEPEIILINFGDAEALKSGSANIELLENDLKFYVNKYFNLPTAIRIVLITPGDINQINLEAFEDLHENVIPAIENVAYQTNSEIIDLVSLLSSSKDNYSDDVNLSPKGASMVAKSIFEALDMRSEHDFNFVYSMGMENEAFEYKGFAGSEFLLFGWKCTVINPKKTAIGRPWVWKFGKLDDNTLMDQQFLQKGFHIMHINTDGLYGNDMAMDRLSRFYDFIQQGRMAVKPVLTGNELSAVDMFNWASHNTEKIGFIYSKNPVLDLHSFPEGSGTSKGDEALWKEVRKAWDIKSDKKLAEWMGGNPVDKQENWKNASVPIIFVNSSLNDQIPFEENGGAFLEGLNLNPDPIIVNSAETVDVIHTSSLILNTTGYKTNYSIVAESGIENRAIEAGWKLGTDWWDQHNEIKEIVNNTRPDILFLGDEITQGIGGKRQLLMSYPGEEAFSEVYKDLKWVNGGVHGDKTQNMIFRIVSGSYNLAGVKMVVITAGINNFEENSADEIARGIATLVRVIERQMPDTKILVTGPLPVGSNENDPLRLKYDDIHARLQKISWGDFVTYRRLMKEFYDSFGDLKQGLYQEDNIHLAPKGYQAWAEWVRPFADQILKSH